MDLSKYQMDALNNCLKCSICLGSCPVANVNPKFPGPKQLGVDWLRIAQETGEQPNVAVDYCSNCKTCEAVCPSGVRIATLNQLAKSSFPNKGIDLRKIIFSDPSKLGKLIHVWPQAGNLITGLPVAKFMTEKTVGISAQAPMPRYSTKKLRKLLSQYQPKYFQTPMEVLYFPGCFTQYNKPGVGMALVKILSKLNYKVIIPEFKCCGQPSISNANLKDTKKFAGANLRLIKQHLKNGIPIIFSCPSCLLTLREEYTDVLGLEEFSKYTPAMMDAGEFLLGHENQIKDILTKEEKPKLNLAYHEPCHLKVSGQGTPSLTILKEIVGINITPLEAGCCGLAGSYGLKKEKHWIAEEIGKNLKDAISSLNPQAVVTECGMCSVQVNHLSQLPVYHPLELLAEMIEE